MKFIKQDLIIASRSSSLALNCGFPFSKLLGCIFTAPDTVPESNSEDGFFVIIFRLPACDAAP